MRPVKESDQHVSICHVRDCQTAALWIVPVYLSGTGTAEIPMCRAHATPQSKPHGITGFDTSSHRCLAPVSQ